MQIAVRDHGVGIPHAEQQKIFEKFVRGSEARASGVRGTGIGLATARQIVRAHHGDIALEKASRERAARSAWCCRWAAKSVLGVLNEKRSLRR